MAQAQRRISVRASRLAMARTRVRTISAKAAPAIMGTPPQLHRLVRLFTAMAQITLLQLRSFLVPAREQLKRLTLTLTETVKSTLEKYSIQTQHSQMEQPTHQQSRIG